MLTPSEKRFLRSWEEQREDGKWSYILTYCFAASFIVMMITYITILWFLGEKVPRPLWITPAGSVVIGCLISFASWKYSERKFKKIVRREIKVGEEKEADINPGSAI